MSSPINFTPTTFYDTDSPGHPQSSDPYINSAYFNSREQLFQSLVNAVNAVPESARDAVGTALVAGSGISITVNDAADTITLAATGSSSYSDENAQDAIAALIAAGTQSGITFTYNDAANTLSATVTAQTWSQITGKPNFATVSTSGDYNDLTNKPSIPTDFTQSSVKTSNYTAANKEIVRIDTTGGNFTVTGPVSGASFGARWTSGTIAPIIAAPSGYTIAGQATLNMGLAPATSTGELVIWQAFGTDYQPVGGFKPQTALNSVYVRQLPAPSGDTTGTTDKSVIQSALDAVAASGGGWVRCYNGGQYIAAGLVIDTGVFLDLAGGGITAPAAANDSVVRTKDYATLIAGDTTNGPRDWGISNGYLDGNRANQTDSNTGPVLAIYGRRYVIDNVIVRGGRGIGLHTKWSTYSAFISPNSMEAFVTRFYVHSCTGDGIRFEGPHDAYFQNFFVTKAGDTGTTSALNLPDSTGRANGSSFDKFHLYGGNGYNYALTCNTSGTKFTNFVAEGGQVAQCLIQTSQVQFDAAHLYSGGIQVGSVKGIQMGDSTHTGVNGSALRAKIENCGGGAFDFTYMGDHNFIDAHVYYYTQTTAPTLPNLGFVGTPSPLNKIGLYVAGPDFLPTVHNINQSVGPYRTRRVSATDTRDLVDVRDQGNTVMYTVDYLGRPRSKAGSTPTIAVGTNIGTGSPAVALTGTDHSGTITITTGTGPAAGQLAGITFGSPFGATPRAVIITPKDSGSAVLQSFVTTAASGFSLRCAGTPNASTAYSFDFVVIGS